MHRPHFLLPDWSQGWGLGCGSHATTPARASTTRQPPGYKSSLLLDPSSRVGVILLMNATTVRGS